MNSMGRCLNYGLHKRIMLSAIFVIILVIYSLWYYSIGALGILMDVDHLDALLFYIVIGILGGARIALYFMYNFLLISVRLRYRQLNQLMKYGSDQSRHLDLQVMIDIRFPFSWLLVTSSHWIPIWHPFKVIATLKLHW